MSEEVEWNIEKPFEDEEPTNPLQGVRAKRDFLIVQNEFRADIKEGDDLGDIPERFHQNLKTEGVI